MSVALSSNGIDRTWQRKLDVCLSVLEDAHERDEQIVSPALSAQVRPLVPGVVCGMPIAQALDLVFQAQDECLQAVTSMCVPDAAPAAHELEDGEHIAEPLDATSARVLTERIRCAANNFSLLLLEAQERQAWLALGYRTWERYVRQEFGLSRTRSYELLDHGRLIRAVHAITGQTLTAEIPPYAARKVKPYFGQFIAGLRTQIAERPAEEVPGIVREAMRSARPRPAAGRIRVLERRDPSLGQLTDRVANAVPLATIGQRARKLDAEVLWMVIEYLASLPPPGGVVGQLVAVGGDWSTVDRATAWLADLRGELQARRRGPEGTQRMAMA